MVNHMRGTQKKITDFQPGSVARTLVEGPAVEVEELYLQMFLGLREAIPVATFLSFGFDKKPSARATGFVSVSADDPIDNPITVPEGATFTTVDGRVYTSTETVIWQVGESFVRIPVRAEDAGTTGNAAAGMIDRSSFFGSGFTISNSAINTGRDVETDPEREARFAEFVGALSRGTVAACLYAAKQAEVLDENGISAEYVTRVGILENPGYVRLYIRSSSGYPSAALQAAGQRIIDGYRDPGRIVPGYRSGGVRVDVLPMVDRAVALAVRVGMLDGFVLDAGVEQLLNDAFSTVLAGVRPGQVLLIGDLVDELLRVPGVLQVVPESNANIVCGEFEALVAGALSVTPV